MRTLRTSVRRLVEFLLRSGDIDTQGSGRANLEAMQAGGEIHRMLQASAGPSYQAEVPLSGSFYFPQGTFNPHAARLKIRKEAVAEQEGFFLTVEGRADGIIDDGTHPLVIDEIKGVARDVSTIQEPQTLHEAQALCYAYLYLRDNQEAFAPISYDKQVVVRVTYASMTTGEVRQVQRTHAAADLEAWFFSLLDAAQRWAAWRIRHDELRDHTLSALTFPFAPREAQKTVMDAVVSTIHTGGRLYVQAPTGSGKTIATLYPALKAIGSGEVSRIAYLTAKTTTRHAALECLALLRQRGLATNVLVVTARDKICPLRLAPRDGQVRSRPLSSLCNPLECPLARSHYDHANDALFEAIDAYDVLDANAIETVAGHHHVCPYELQHDATHWADVIVCDYHHAFAPGSGFFGLANKSGDAGTAYLVDEAHNLVERLRDLYSAELRLADLKGFEQVLRRTGSHGELAATTHDVVQAFPRWEKALPANPRPGGSGRKHMPSYQATRPSDAFVALLTKLADASDAALEQLATAVGNQAAGNRYAQTTGYTAPELFLALQDTSLGLRSFLGALERGGPGYVSFLGRTNDGGRRLKVFCVDPSHELSERLEQVKATVFFSGTLLPMDYHRKLLAAQDDASIYAKSSFDYRRQRIIIASDVSARFSGRGPALYAHIATYLRELTRARPGNYLVFLPSYAFLGDVEKALVPHADPHMEIVRQQPGMRERERDAFVNRFCQPRATGTSLVGLCVLGGIFGESIDLPGQKLVGVVVVGTGMPGASSEREVTRDYFDAKGGKGFAYAYTYPGMIKVLQAAGRLIRTEDDYGIVLLLDDRFLEDELQTAFPQEWQDVRTCTIKTLPSLLGRRCLPDA